MNDNLAPPSDPQGAEPGAVDGEPSEPGGGSAPEAVVAEANAVTRRTLTVLVAMLFAFGSCGIAYGVFRVAGGDGGGTVTVATGPGSPSVSVSPSPDPSESVTPSPSGPGADLVISSLTQTQVVVQNIGADPAGRFVVSVGGQAFIVEDGLGPGQSATFSYKCREGPLTGVADSTERVEESDETNNARTEGPFDCQSPSPSPSGSPSPSPSPSPTGTNRRPDLIVNAVAQDRVTVSNIGVASAGAFVVNVDNNIGSFNVAGLAAGASRTINFSCTSGQLTATVDVTNNVAETNENNNSKTGGPFNCLADLIVSAIGANSVTISNIGDGDAGPSVVAIGGQTFQVPAIQAGGKAQIDYPCVGGFVKVLADAFDQIVESNERNNIDSRDVGNC